MHSPWKAGKTRESFSVKWNWFRIGVVAATCVTAVTLLAALGLAGSFVFLAPSLPSSTDMRNVELAVPLRVYTRGGQLVAQIGEQRRIPVTYEQIPEVVRNAFLAAEDDRFFSHHGIDYAGVLRAAAVNFFTGNRAQGASTITMQVARNMFLTQKREWRRKLQEVFLTWRMEREFTKEQILALYLNVIFFGQRSYGVAAAAETYFGKPLDALTIGEAALLAGIPKAPTDTNPIANPRRAHERRGYVLRRMRELGFIDEAGLAAANAEPVTGKMNAPLNDVDAPYVAEMARLELVRRFGEAAQNAGYRVFTTVDPRLQMAANRALRLGLLEYDRRRGWRGAMAQVALPAQADAAALDALLAKFEPIGNLDPAVVVALEARSARVHLKGGGNVTIPWDGLAWARRVTGEDARGPALVKRQRRGLRDYARCPIFISLVLTVFFTRFIDGSFGPQLPLYISTLHAPAARLGVVTGLIMTLGAVATSVAAAGAGRLSSRYAPRRLLLGSLIGGAVFCLPIAFINHWTQLLVLRTLLGLLAGGALILAYAIAGRDLPADARLGAIATLAGLGQIGMAVSPFLAGLLAKWINLPSIFVLDGIIYLVLSAWVWLRLAPAPVSAEPEPASTIAVRSSEE